MTLKELIYAARGDHRNMKEFAVELGMSPAKLYKIADGDIRKAPPDADLQIIANKAVPGSGVTYELLKEACDNVLREKARSKAILSSRAAELVSFASQMVYQSALSSGAKVQAIDLKHLSPQANTKKTHGHFCDMGLEIECAALRQKAFFAFRLSDEKLNAEKTERFIGQIFHTGYSEDEFYYLVFIEYRPSQNPKVASLVENLLKEDFSEVRLPVNMSIVYIIRNNDTSCQMSELSLSPAHGILSFNS